MKRDFEKALLASKCAPSDDPPILWSAKFMAGEVGMYMSYWYSGLFVVCEGWKELGLTDPAVDSLMTQDKFDLLRRYRNGTLHFQKDYLDDRFIDFCAAQSSVDWVRSLSSAVSVC